MKLKIKFVCCLQREIFKTKVF